MCKFPMQNSMYKIQPEYVQRYFSIASKCDPLAMLMLILPIKLILIELN